MKALPAQAAGSKMAQLVARTATARLISPSITAEHQKLTAGHLVQTAHQAVWFAANAPQKPAPPVRLPLVRPAVMPLSQRTKPVRIPATPGVSPVHTPATIRPALIPARPELLPAERTAFRDVNMSSAAMQAKDIS